MKRNLLLAALLAGCDDQQAELGIWPATISFGQLEPGQLGEETLLVSNTGATSLTVHSLWANPPFRTQTTSLELELDTYQAVVLTVQVDEPGPVSGPLIISSDDPNNPIMQVPLRAYVLGGDSGSE